jgi:hypothetical protein
MKPQAGSGSVGLGDERRDLVRVKVKLLFEFWLQGGSPESGPCESDQSTDEAITALITKPTQDLLAAEPGVEAGALLVPWLMKLDWTLALMLKTLAKLNPDPIAMPRLAEVDISGGGLSFTSSRPLQEGDILELRLILPPFVPIPATAEVVRVVPTGSTELAEVGQGASYAVATRFASIDPEDRERLIRHIFQVQSERLRARSHTVE